MSDLSGWSTLPDNVIANILSFCLPFECINTCKADPRRLLPNVIRTKTPAITQDTGPAILNRLLYANLKRVIDRSNICAARSFSGGDIMGTLESLHLSMISKDSTKIFTSCFGTSWPFNMLIAGAYIHQAVLGITLPDDLDHNRSTRDQLDLYVTTKSALDVRTALMHDLDLVLTATSNGHLYRNNRAIQQIEHYVSAKISAQRPPAASLLLEQRLIKAERSVLNSQRMHMIHTVRVWIPGIIGFTVKDLLVVISKHQKGAMFYMNLGYQDFCLISI